jgi:hypothetical protein
MLLWWRCRALKPCKIPQKYIDIALNCALIIIH